MNDTPKSAEHEATHIIDEGCCIVMDACNRMLDAAFEIGAGAELRALADATKALHARAKTVHQQCIARKLQ